MGGISRSLPCSRYHFSPPLALFWKMKEGLHSEDTDLELQKHIYWNKTIELFGCLVVWFDWFSDSFDWLSNSFNCSSTSFYW